MCLLLPTLAHHNHDKFEIFAFAELENEDKVSQEYKSYEITGYELMELQTMN